MLASGDATAKPYFGRLSQVRRVLRHVTAALSEWLIVDLALEPRDGD
jgi:hypothetical protein